MLAYLVRRLAWSFVLVLAVALVTFIIFFVIPTNRVGNVRHRETTTNINEAVGIHGPVYLQYGRFLWHLGHGSLGNSFRSEQSVRDLVLAAAPVTASLVIGGAIVWLLIAFSVGILSALRPRSVLDRASTIFVLIGDEPRTDWLRDTLQRDGSGFVLTGRDVSLDGWTLDRPPMLLETSVPGVFAVGDVRNGSVKRVNAAVGDGSVAVGSVHAYLAEAAELRTRPG